VENRRDETWVEIVEQPLAENGWPTGADASADHFLARFSGFLDPAFYAAGRSIQWWVR
jgi:starvation-inducible outer membrane lipoprotein